MPTSKKSTRPVKATIKATAKTVVKKPAAKVVLKAAAKSPAKPVKVAKAAKPAAPAAKAPILITTEIIASQAYLLWEQAGRPHGRSEEFWITAETQLKHTSTALAA